MAIDVDLSNGVATILLNRPEALNAFNNDQLNLLLAALRTLRDERAARCVIVTGAGDRGFAAGADIKHMATLSEADALAFGRLGHAVMYAVESLPVPVIAAVNGFALGGGCELALACDMRLASENAVFSQPEVSLGIPPGWGGTQRLPRLVGPGIAAELIYTGRKVDSAEALRIGLVNAVYPRDQLLVKATDMATAIAKNSPRALAASKQAIHLAFNSAAPSGLDAEVQLFARAFGTRDQREGMHAFIEKRAPEFANE
ncbi:MAG: enoyl-CoA hydratase/isomerase family protein [Thermomicrobiales bacterium]